MIMFSYKSFNNYKQNDSLFILAKKSQRVPNVLGNSCVRSRKLSSVRDMFGICYIH